MSETPKKKPAARKAKPATRKPAARKPVARAARPAPPTDRTIRNLRSVPVHVRLGPTRDPYRVQLQPRGSAGDYDTIPANLVGQLKDVGVLYEFLTETERRELEYGSFVYPEREHATILREEDTVISTQDDWDGKGRIPQQRRDSRGHAIPENDRRNTGAGPAYADVPGSDAALHEGLREGAKDQGRRQSDAALPPGVSFDRKVSVERTRGQ